MNIADQLANARTRQNLTQRELADAVGVSHTYISKVENGHATPSRQFVENVARALSLPLSLFAVAPTVTARDDGRFAVKLRNVVSVLTADEVRELGTACFAALGES